MPGLTRPQPDQPARGSYAAIASKCFINAPFAELRRGLLPLFLGHRFRPEIGLDGDCLLTASRSDFREVAGQLRTHGLACTLHGPFTGLSPGGSDARQRQATRDKLRRAVDLAELFRPRALICHLGFDPYNHAQGFDEWLDHSLATWNEILEQAAASGTPVLFENTYETTPAIHHALFTALAARNPGFCLDVGHLTAFARSTWQVFLATLLPWLRHLHLHDNHGERDEHIAIGNGCVPFRELFAYLRQEQLDPGITLEPHSEEDLWQSLQAIAELGLFGHLGRA